jgi:iron(III) transport system permease protein
VISLPAALTGRLSLSRSWDPWPAILLVVVAITSVVILSLLAVILWLSFRDGGPGDPDATYSLFNYPDVFLDPFTYRVLVNTVGFSLVTLIVAFAFGVPIAWLVERTDLPGKNALFTLMTVGLLLPGFAVAMAWLFLLHARIGLVNQWLRSVFGLAAAPFNISTVLGMGWVQGLSLAPLAFIMTAAVFRAMDPTLEESAQISGASFLQTLRRVTLPLAGPGVLAAGIYVFMIGFAAFDVPAIIGWGSRVFTFSSYLVLQLSPETNLPQYGVVAALAAVMILLAGVFSWWYARMQSRAHQFQVVTGKAYRPNIIALRRWKPAAWSYVGLYLCLSVVLPALVLVWISLLPYFQLPSAAGFATASLARYHNLPWRLVGEALVNTGALMVLTPTVTLLVSLAFSWIVLRSRVPGRAWFDFVAFLPHAVPSIVFGIGALLITLYVVEAVVPIFGTIWILLAVFVIARVSYATRMTNSGLIQIHREIEESGQISGATTGGVLRRIVAPLIAPTVLYAWLWIALLTFRELTLAVVLTTRDNMTLPIVIWNDWQSGGLGDAAAIAVVMLLMMLPIIWLYWLVARRQGIKASA